MSGSWGVGSLGEERAIGNRNIYQRRFVAVGRHIFVAQTIADGNVRSELPAILEVIGLSGLTKLRNRQRCGVGSIVNIAEHEVGRRVPGSLVLDAIEPAGILISGDVETGAINVGAKLERMV